MLHIEVVAHGLCNGLQYFVMDSVMYNQRAFDGYIGICIWYMVEVHGGYMVETSS